MEYWLRYAFFTHYFSPFYHFLGQCAGGWIVVAVMVIVGSIGGRGWVIGGKWIAGGLGTQLCYLEVFYKHKLVNLAMWAHNTHLAVVKKNTDTSSLIECSKPNFVVAEANATRMMSRNEYYISITCYAKGHKGALLSGSENFIIRLHNNIICLHDNIICLHKNIIFEM